MQINFMIVVSLALAKDLFLIGSNIRKFGPLFYWFSCTTDISDIFCGLYIYWNVQENKKSQNGNQQFFETLELKCTNFL